MNKFKTATERCATWIAEKLQELKKEKGEPGALDDEDLEECDLTCGPQRKVHEFVGPVKIVFVEVNPLVYCRRIIGAGFLTLVSLLMGGVMIHMVYLGIMTLRSEKWAKKAFWIPTHIFLYYFGFQVFMPIAILYINPLYGPSSALRPLKRRNTHLANQITAIVLILFASILLFIGLFGSKKNKFTVHSITGGIGVKFMFLAISSGLTSFFKVGKTAKKEFCIKATHIMFGLPSLIFGTVSFVTGLLRPVIMKEFKSRHENTYENVPYILSYLSAIICLIVCVGPIYKVITCQFGKSENLK